ncbi:39S ribosomal protein L21, mitochondrial-like, partial [Orbicella faveolata]|uniref:39S ribosomal protein L21, mitochondrial-like n=1 Tax=Orbicella faveolata TaxID=48498 RepID=UPI0009E5FF93
FWILLFPSLSYDSFKTYSTAAAAVTQFSSTNLVSLLGNVDVRSLSAASSGSLTEAGGEEDDEQNCPQSSRSMLKYDLLSFEGGSQFKITLNDTILINRIDAETGDRIRIEKVLLVGGENFTVVGTPLVARDLVRVEATVLEKTKGPKKIVFKMKRRKGYRKWKEHYQDITVLRINSIQVQPSLLSSAP